jgi:UDP-galactopyranose mutase
MFDLYKAESVKHPTVQSVGRLGQFKYINMDECIGDCFTAVNCVG